MGQLYGEITLSRLFLGSGGGGGGAPAGTFGGGGGNGGGILFIAVDDIFFDGSISANGQATGSRSGAGDGGAGSGGSIRIEGNTIQNISSVLAEGGTTTGEGGAGGVGRIAVYYSDSFAGSFSPNYLERNDPESPMTDSLFNSSLEQGDLSEWDNSYIGNNDLIADPSASYWGNYGLKVHTAANSIFVQDTLETAEAHYRARFYFNPNSFTPGTGNIIEVLNGYHGSTNVIKLQLQKSASIYQVRLGALEGATWSYSGWATIANAWNALEIEYYASPNTGQMTLWVNGTQAQVLRSLDNGDNTLNIVRLGKLDTTTGNSGTIWFDDFDSRRLSYIGTLPDPGTHIAPPTPDSGTKVYTYGDPAHLHAVTDASIENTSVGTYQYDDNGNMTCRIENDQTFAQTYNAEDRMESVQLVSGDCMTQGETLQTWAFTYDGDGSKVQQDYFDGSSTVTTLYFFGGAYEVKDPGLNQTSTKYYSIAGMTIAMDDGTDLMYFLTDHLGSVIAVLDDEGSMISEQRYLPFGKVRTDLGPATQTDFGYTFQRNLPEMGLMDYKAPMNDHYLNRWTQPDTIVADPYNSQSFNRYSYVGNNPIMHNDPSGHCFSGAIIDTVICLFYIALVAGGVIGGAVSIVDQSQNGQVDPINVVRDAMGGAVIGGAPFVGIMAVPDVVAIAGDAMYSAGESLNAFNATSGIANKLMNAGTNVFAASNTINSFLNGPWSAVQTNSPLLLQSGGTNNPRMGPIIPRTLQNNTTYFRYWNTEDQNEMGIWVTSWEASSADAAKDLLSLPSTPNAVSIVTAPKGFQIQDSLASPLFGNNGYGSQTELLSRITKSMFSFYKMIK